MSDVMTALPARPLHARLPGRVAGQVWALLGFLVMLAMLVFAVAWVAPVLVTDWQVRETAVPIAGGHISDGSCSNRLFLDWCDATLTAPVQTAKDAATTITREVHYIFGSFNLGDFTARVLADPKRPEWLTTDLGLDYFWDRALTLLLTLAFLGLVLWGGVVAMLRSRRVRASWRQAELGPVALTLVGVKKTRNGAIWTVRGQSGRLANWTLPRRAKPFVLGPADRVLGLATRGEGAIVPLDAGLRWVDLTAEERRAALAARG